MRKKVAVGYEPRLKPPYHIKNINGIFYLKNGDKLIKPLRAESANGADREAAAHLGYPPTTK